MLLLTHILHFVQLVQGQNLAKPKGGHFLVEKDWGPIIHHVKSFGKTYICAIHFYLVARVIVIFTELCSASKYHNVIKKCS